MAFFDFVKKAGEKALRNSKNPKEDIKSLLSKMNLPNDDLDINLEDDKLQVSGKVENQETREKIILSLGNILGISGVDENLEIATPEEEAQFYTVASGDSLSKIAKEFYGNAMKYPEIFEANKPMLSDPDKIYPGQVLRIPKLD